MSYVYLVSVKVSQYEQVEIESDKSLSNDEASEKAANLAEKMFECDELETGNVELSLTRSIISEAAQPPLNADGAKAQEKSVCPICGEPEYCIHCDN